MVTNKETPRPDADENMIEAQEILTLPGAQVLERLGTSLAGLSKEESERRLELYGANTITGKGKSPVVLQFLSHFKNPITIILLAAGILSGILGDFTNLVIIFIIVLISVTLDFTQEYRAERAAETLKKRVATTATVVRDGNKQEIDVTELVLGDIIALSAGDVVPADARVLNARDFFVDQSALTGESFPAEKFTEPPAELDAADTSRWTHYLFMGTSVTNGTATAVVVRTGGDTQYGEIVRRNIERKPETEFERGLRRFGYLILQVSLVLVVFVFVDQCPLQAQRAGLPALCRGPHGRAHTRPPADDPLGQSGQRLDQHGQERRHRQEPGRHPELRQHGCAVRG